MQLDLQVIRVFIINFFSDFILEGRREILIAMRTISRTRLVPGLSLSLHNEARKRASKVNMRICSDLDWEGLRTLGFFAAKCAEWLGT